MYGWTRFLGTKADDPHQLFIMSQHELYWWVMVIHYDVWWLTMMHYLGLILIYGDSNFLNPNFTWTVRGLTPISPWRNLVIKLTSNCWLLISKPISWLKNMFDVTLVSNNRSYQFKWDQLKTAHWCTFTVKIINYDIILLNQKLYPRVYDKYILDMKIKYLTLLFKFQFDWKSLQ